MGELITAAILAVCVFVLSYLGCMFALLAQRRWLAAIIAQKLDDPDMNARLGRVRAASNLCEQQLAHQFEVSKRRLAEIHRLQFEVRVLKFGQEARESGAESGGTSGDEQRVANGSDRQDGVSSPQGGAPTDDGVVDRADEVSSGG